jgi:act minimal PKS acyl carrier protein
MTENAVVVSAADLLRILRQVAGSDEGIDLDGEDVSDVPLNELGYDSLAVLELAACTERVYAIRIPDSDLKNEMTPREVVAYVNARLAEARALCQATPTMRSSSPLRCSWSGR